MPSPRRKKDDDWFEGSPQVRRRKENHPKDPSVWLDQHKMTQTEVGLRVAAWLAAADFVDQQVCYHMAGYELTRTGSAQFPVKRFLIERLGYLPKYVQPNGWEGSYQKQGSQDLVLQYGKGDGQVNAILKGNQFFACFVTGGLLRESRSPAEHKKFWQVVGRAMTSRDTIARSLLAVCVPRSPRYRKLATEFREAEGVLRGRLSVMTVDRTGHVDGFCSTTRELLDNAESGWS